MNNIQILQNDMETTAWVAHVPNSTQQNDKIIRLYTWLQSPDAIDHVTTNWGNAAHDAIFQTITYLYADGYMIQSTWYNVHKIAWGHYSHIMGDDADGKILLNALDYVWNN